MFYMADIKINPEDSIATLLEAKKKYWPLVKEYTHKWENGHKFNQRDIRHFNAEFKKIENFISSSSGDWDQNARNEALQQLQLWRVNDLGRLESIQKNADSEDNALIIQTADQEMFTLFDTPYTIIDNLLKAQNDYNEKKYYSR